MESPNRFSVDIYSPEDDLRSVNWPQFLDVRPIVGESIYSINNQHSRKIARIEHGLVKFDASTHSFMQYVMKIELERAVKVKM